MKGGLERILVSSVGGLRLWRRRVLSTLLGVGMWIAEEVVELASLVLASRSFVLLFLLFLQLDHSTFLEAHHALGCQLPALTPDVSEGITMSALFKSTLVDYLEQVTVN